MARKFKTGRIQNEESEVPAGRGREKTSMVTRPEEKGDELLSLTSNFRNIEPGDKWCAAQHAEGLQFEYANK